MADGEDNEQNLLRWARSKRSAEFDDNVVELVRPLGLVLNEDKMGNVYVETVAPKGNAARTGKVRKGIQKRQRDRKSSRDRCTTVIEN